MEITIETVVKAPLETVWDAWTTAEDVTQWNFASDDWCCPKAEIDLRLDGFYRYRMEAKDGSAGFDLYGRFMQVRPYEFLESFLDDNRMTSVLFSLHEEGTHVIQTFQTEDSHSPAEQEAGWQAILDNFKRYVENKSTL